MLQKGKGSGLILRPETVLRLFKLLKAGGLPVSVKTRLGYYDIEEWRDWLKHVLNKISQIIYTSSNTQRDE